MKELPDESVDLMVTSPPYNINISYGNKWKKGKAVESKGKKYDDNMPEDMYRELLKETLKETTRVLKPNGTLFINMKNRMIDDSMVAPHFIVDYVPELFLKNIIIWNFDWGGSTSKRFSSRYEYVFFFSKNKKTWTFNLDDISIPSLNYRPDRYKTQFKNPTDVWTIPLVSGNSVERTEHPAQYPEKLIERIIKAVTNEGDLVLDPFMGSGTSAIVAKRLNRDYVGYEINQEYIDIANKRLKNAL
jgi:DNA modification methylase